jgi:hypothetical protein
MIWLIWQEADQVISQGGVCHDRRPDRKQVAIFRICSPLAKARRDGRIVARTLTSASGCFEDGFGLLIHGLV